MARNDIEHERASLRAADAKEGSLVSVSALGEDTAIAPAPLEIGGVVLKAGASGTKHPQRLKAVLWLVLITMLCALTALAVVLFFKPWDNQTPTQVSWAVGNTHHKNPSPVASGLTQPAFVSADGRHLSQSLVLPVANGSVMLQYTATLATTNIVAVDREPRIVNATCHPAQGGYLQLTFESAAAAAAAATQFAATRPIVTGGHQWGCSPSHFEAFEGNSTAAASILFRVVGVMAHSGDVVKLSVAPVELASLFEHLSVHHTFFSYERPPNASNLTSHVMQGAAAAGAPPTPAGTSTAGDSRRRLRSKPASESAERREERRLSEAHWWQRIFSFTRDFLDSVASTLASIRHATTVLATAVFTGSLDLPAAEHSIVDFRWPSAASPLDGIPADFGGGSSPVPIPTADGVSFEGSELRLGCGVEFGLEVRSYELQSMEVTLHNHVDVTAAVALEGARWTFDTVFPILQDQTLGTTVFFIGPIPFHLALQFDLGLHLKAQVEAVSFFTLGPTAAFSGSVQALSDARYGVRYNSSGWFVESGSQWARSFTGPTSNVHQANAQVSAGLVPSLSLEIDWIGAVDVDVIPYLSSVLALNDESVSGETSDIAVCQTGFGWGVDVHVGADIKLENPATNKPFYTTSIARAKVYESGLQPLSECHPCDNTGQLGTCTKGWQQIFDL